MTHKSCSPFAVFFFFFQAVFFLLHSAVVFSLKNLGADWWCLNYKMLLFQHEVSLAAASSAAAAAAAAGKKIGQSSTFHLSKKRYFGASQLFATELGFQGDNCKTMMIVVVSPAKTMATTTTTTTTTWSFEWYWHQKIIAALPFKIGEPFGIHVVKCSPWGKMHRILLQWNLCCIWHDFQHLLQLQACTHKDCWQWLQRSFILRCWPRNLELCLEI